MASNDVDALLVGPGADLSYLTGYHALALERLTMLVLARSGDALLVVPELEHERALAAGAQRLVDVATWPETTDPVALVVDHLGPAGKGRIAVQDRLWTSFTLRLQAAMPHAAWIEGSQITHPLRVVKDDAELDAVSAAAEAIDAVHARVPEVLRPGRRERDVARDLAEMILEDHEKVNFVIVASGPNGASPHHETGERVIENGDAVVVDIGGTRQGYCSDATRNYVVGHAPDGYAEMHEVLLAAQRAAVDAVAPGVAAEDVDAAARRVITDAGFGAAFVHRTGHGIGLEEHEEPWIVEGNTTPLAVNMTFSIEPGIYLGGRYGARIEDIVAVEAGQARRLNRRPRDLTVCSV